MKVEIKDMLITGTMYHLLINMSVDILNELNKRLQEMNAALTPKKFPLLTPLRIIAGTGLILFPTYLIFREKINNHLATEGGKIAGAVVVSNDVKTSLDALLTDKTTKKTLTDATKYWLSDKETQNMLTDVTKEWLSSSTTHDMLTDVTSQWLEKEETQNMLADAIIRVCKRDDVREALIDLTKHTLVSAVPALRYVMPNVQKNDSDELK